MSVTIREAAPRDRGRLVDLLHQLNVHEDAITGDRRTDHVAAEENLDSLSAWSQENGGRFLVAEVGGHVAGLLVLLFKVDDIYIREERRPYALIADIVVDAKHRRQGIGRALMTAAEEAAAAAGYGRLLISVLAGNREAEAAYAKQGFLSRGRDLEKAIPSKANPAPTPEPRD